DLRVGDDSGCLWRGEGGAGASAYLIEREDASRDQRTAQMAVLLRVRAGVVRDSHPALMRVALHDVSDKVQPLVPLAARLADVAGDGTLLGLRLDGGEVAPDDGVGVPGTG